MPDFRIIVKCTKLNRSQRIDKGMEVYVHTNQFTNPVIADKDSVAYAFKMRGVDIVALGALNTSYLDAKRID